MARIKSWSGEVAPRDYEHGSHLILKKAKVASEPDALIEFFKTPGFAVKRIGLEAGPLSQWLHAGLKEQDTKRSCWKRGM